MNLTRRGFIRPGKQSEGRKFKRELVLDETNFVFGWKGKRAKDNGIGIVNRRLSDILNIINKRGSDLPFEEFSLSLGTK